MSFGSAEASASGETKARMTIVAIQNNRTRPRAGKVRLGLDGADIVLKQMPDAQRDCKGAFRSGLLTSML
jgi:hypothetical protein